jgi:hypothetical protein
MPRPNQRENRDQKKWKKLLSVMDSAYCFSARFHMKKILLVPLFLSVAAAHSSEPIKVGAFTFAVPNGWKSVTPSSPMRKAQLEIAKGSEKAEVTFFQFEAGQGGNTADNVSRWFEQFPGSDEKRKTETSQAGSIKITFASTEGTFKSGMPGGPTTPKTGYALYGAILESSTGTLFVKMTGPELIVKDATDAFKKMITDAAKESGTRA